MIELSRPWQEAARPGRRVGHAIEAHLTIGSTNDRARELVANEGIVVIAEEQTSGRGRRGRGWHSPPGRGIAMSAAVRPRLAAGDAWQLALAAGLAAAAACEPVARVGLKWPNDVVSSIDGRKLGGVLIETVIAGDRVDAAVIGVGLNAMWPRSDMPADIRDEATSLGELAGTGVDRVALLDRLLDALSDEIEAIERGESPLGRYRTRCTTLGTVVTAETAAGTVTGRAVDLDERGTLVVEAPDGRHVLDGSEVLRVRGGGS